MSHFESAPVKSQHNASLLTRSNLLIFPQFEALFVYVVNFEASFSKKLNRHWSRMHSDAGLIKRGFDFELMRHLATSSKNFWKHVTMTLLKKGHSDVRRKPKLEAKYINTT